jgi:hypothetical protein
MSRAIRVLNQYHLTAKVRDRGQSRFFSWKWIFVLPLLCLAEDGLRDELSIIDKAA